MSVSGTKFSSTQIPLVGALRERLLEMGRLVGEGELTEDGVETDPHITCRFGLHTQTAGPVRKLLSRVQRPVRFRLGKVSVFSGADSGRDYDVVKVDVDSPDLHVLHRLLGTLPHTDTHPEYKPHATVCYVKRGLGQRVADRMGSVGLKGQSGVVMFSDRDRNQTEIPLTREDRVPMSRTVPLKFEAEKPVHGLVAGTRMERVLKHLANHPDTDPNVKLLSKQVLHQGDTTALRPLYDALQDQNHPLSHSYNWPAAEWKLHLDAAVGHALDSLTRHQTESGLPEKEARSLALEYVRNANSGVRRQFLQNRGFVDPGVSAAATEAVGILHGIGHSKDDIQDSLNRHQLRTRDAVNPTRADTKALTEKPERDVMEVAARYSKKSKRTPIHPLVKGTRLALVLKHLAKTGNPTTRSLAKGVLKHGQTHSLLALADHLQTPPEEGGESNHELAPRHEEFGNAANKLILDEKVHPLVREHWSQMGELPEAEKDAQMVTGIHAHSLADHIHKNKANLSLPEFKQLVEAKHGPISDQDLEGSLRRMAIKGRDYFRTQPSEGYDADDQAWLNRQKEERVKAALKGKAWAPDGQQETDRDIEAEQFKFSRTSTPRRGNFLAALKRVQSKQQGDLRKLAQNLYQKLNLDPARVRDAIHSSGQLASAGVASALYHNSDPDRVRFAAAQYGLASQSPALLLFHVGEGPDAVHKVSVRGSGEGLLKSLDRAGLHQRTLVPTKTGYDVFVPDFGSKLTRQVQDFAKSVGSSVSSARGQGEVMGNGSDSVADPDSRSSYRNVIEAYQSRQNPSQEPPGAGVQP